MFRVRIEERVRQLLENDLDRGAHEAIGRPLGRRGVVLDARRDRRPALAREHDFGARLDRRLDHVLLRGARWVLLSGAMLIDRTCGVTKRPHDVVR